MTASSPKLPTGYNQAADDAGLPLDVIASNLQAKSAAVDMKSKAAAWTLIDLAATAREQGDEAHARVLLEAAQDLVEEILRWHDAWESIRRGAIEAADLALSCAAHGTEIRALRTENAKTRALIDRERRARLIAMGWHTECVRTVQAARGSRGVSGLPSSERLISWMETQLPKVKAAHDITLNPPLPRPASTPRRKP